MNKIKDNRVVVCITCAAIAVRKALSDGVIQNADAKDKMIADEVWAKSWNVSIPAEEMEMLDHAQANPQHIMVKALDFGYAVNGV